MRQTMSDVEIIDYYEAAEDKLRALDALAVACRTDRAGMRQRLHELGLMSIEPDTGVQGQKKKAVGGTEARKRNHYRKMDAAIARQMYEEGKNDHEIAAAFGVKHNTVAAWRKRCGLPTKFVPSGREKMTMDLEQKFEAILDSVDAGKSKPVETTGRSEPCEPCMHPEWESCAGCDYDAAVRARYGSPQLAPLPIQPEPAEQMGSATLGELKAYLEKFLAPILDGAQLCIDGKQVREIYGFSVTQPNGIATVDILTRRRS